jgi:hypothetical protein
MLWNKVKLGCHFYRKARKPGKVEKQKMIREKSGINQKVGEFVLSGKIAFATGK